MQQFFSVLEYDEMNSAGSLGIGIILAEYGKNVEAKEIFKVIENSESDPTLVRHAMLNHAHLLMNDENSEFAINLYQAAHAKFPDDTTIQMFLAKALYKRKNYDECQKITTKLLMRLPNDYRLKFNLALCLYNRANQIFSLPVRAVKLTEQTIRDCNVAS